MIPPTRQRHLGYVLKRFPRLSETFVAAELIELQRQGEHVTVFAISRPDESFTHKFLDELTCPVVYLPHRPLRQAARVAGGVLSCLRTDPRGWLRAAAASLWPPRLAGWRRLAQASVLRQEMALRGVDHAHAHFATAAARLANLSWKMGGPDYSVTAHAKDIWHSDVRLDHLLDKLVPATFVATVSEANLAYLRSVMGEHARLHLVPNSVDLRRLRRTGQSGPDRPTVLTVARLVEKKGIEDLIEACRLLTDRGVAVRLEVMGDGPLRSSLETAARVGGVDAVFHGSQPQERVLEAYSVASVFALPCVVAATGDRDGLPTSVLEAMALGVPVVTTGVNGLVDAVVHDRTGLVVPQHDPAALAGAIGRLLADPALAARLAGAARHRIETRFSLEVSVSQLRSLFPKARVS
ncbi:MAG: glycosyltransferase family 4 protein [Acidimicrobiales bacterium]